MWTLLLCFFVGVATAVAVGWVSYRVACRAYQKYTN